MLVAKKYWTLKNVNYIDNYSVFEGKPKNNFFQLIDKYNNKFIRKAKVSHLTNSAG